MTSAAMGIAERLLALESAVVELQAVVQGQGRFPEEGLPGRESSGKTLFREAPAADTERLAQLLRNTRLAAVLARAGYGSPEAVAAAPDEALTAIDGVGDKALKQIHERVTK